MLALLIELALRSLILGGVVWTGLRFYRTKPARANDGMDAGLDCLAVDAAAVELRKNYASNEVAATIAAARFLAAIPNLST